MRVQENTREEIGPEFIADNNDFVLMLYNLNYNKGKGSEKIYGMILKENYNAFVEVLPMALASRRARRDICSPHVICPNPTYRSVGHLLPSYSR